jgi:hypothetical protein
MTRLLSRGVGAGASKLGSRRIGRVLLWAQPTFLGALFLVDRLDLSFDRPNSEMLTGAVVTRDLLDGGSVSDWVLPEAPYFATDWLISTLIWLTGVGPYAFVWLYLIVQFGALVALWALYSKQFSSRSVSHPGVVVAITVVTLVTTLGTKPFIYALVPFWRFGTVLTSLAAVVLSLGLVLKGNRRTELKAGLLFVVVLLGHLSDEMFLVWYLVPTFVTMAWLVVMGAVGRRIGGLWLVVTGVAHGLALILEPEIGRPLETYQAELRVSSVRSRWGELGDVYGDLVTDAPIVVALVVAALVLSVGVVVRVSRLQVVTEPAQVARSFAAMHLLVATVAGTVAQLLLGPGPQLGLRYSLLPIVLGSLIGAYGLVTVLLAQTWLTEINIARWGALLVFVFVVVAVVKPTSLSREVTFRRIWGDPHCVENALVSSGSSRGVTSWPSQNQLMFWSRNRLELVNAAEIGDRFEFGLTPHNSAWVDEPLDFVAIDRIHLVPGTDRWWLSPELVVAVAGEPTAEVDCGRWLVLDYGPGGLDLGERFRFGAQRDASG